MSKLLLCSVKAFASGENMKTYFKMSSAENISQHAKRRSFPIFSVNTVHIKFCFSVVTIKKPLCSVICFTTKSIYQMILIVFPGIPYLR